MSFPNISSNNLYGYNPQPSQQGGINWVQGEAGARAWLITPNSTVLLMDSEADRFYIKSADGSGMPTLKAYEYKELTQAPKEEYINQSQYEEIISRLEKLENPQKTRKAKADDTEQ